MASCALDPVERRSAFSDWTIDKKLLQRPQLMGCNWVGWQTKSVRMFSSYSFVFCALVTAILWQTIAVTKSIWIFLQTDLVRKQPITKHDIYIYIFFFFISVRIFQASLLRHAGKHSWLQLTMWHTAFCQFSWSHRFSRPYMVSTAIGLPLGSNEHMAFGYFFCDQTLPQVLSILFEETSF